PQATPGRRTGNKEEGGGLCAGDPGHGTAHRPDPEPAQRPDGLEIRGIEANNLGLVRDLLGMLA
ncbi:hypothetical protein, partial [Thiolapillus sp.]